MATLAIQGNLSGCRFAIRGAIRVFASFVQSSSGCLSLCARVLPFNRVRIRGISGALRRYLGSILINGGRSFLYLDELAEAEATTRPVLRHLSSRVCRC